MARKTIRLHIELDAIRTQWIGVMRLSKAQFEALFEGLDWRRVTARRVAWSTAA